MPDSKKNSPENEKKTTPQGMYHIVKESDDLVDGCPQCFYQPEKPEEAPDVCPQCFYTPEKEDGDDKKD